MFYELKKHEIADVLESVITLYGWSFDSNNTFRDTE